MAMKVESSTPEKVIAFGTHPCGCASMILAMGIGSKRQDDKSLAEMVRRGLSIKLLTQDEYAALLPIGKCPVHAIPAPPPLHVDGLEI